MVAGRFASLSWYLFSHWQSIMNFQAQRASVTSAHREAGGKVTSETRFFSMSWLPKFLLATACAHCPSRTLRVGNSTFAIAMMLRATAKIMGQAIPKCFQCCYAGPLKLSTASYATCRYPSNANEQTRMELSRSTFFKYLNCLL